ncbi:MAG TPA: hypothetical protein VN256_07110 [Pyrinomonadaceae bacterium]|nr:hypothetical protein [Pyrinomonadaceae bacterium]
MFVRIFVPALVLAVAALALFNQQIRARGTRGNGAAGSPAKEQRDVKLTITPVSADGITPTKNYHVGEKVVVQLTMFNDSDQPVTIFEGDTKYQHRLKLVKDGQQVPFLPEVDAAIANKDVEGPSGGRSVRDPLAPRQSATVSRLDLSEWYGNLEPGRYQLTLWYHPQGVGRITKTNTISFQIVQ